VFGPKPRDYTKKVTKKTKQLALRKALTERVNAGDIIVVDEIKLDSPKTKGFLGVLNALNLGDGGALVVADGSNQNLALASRNVRDVEVTTSNNLNTYQLLRYNKVLVTRGAMEALDARLKQD